MLIVSHALHWVNGHYSVFYLFWQSYTVLVPVLNNHVSDEQLSIRNLKEWQYINYMCFEAHRAI